MNQPLPGARKCDVHSYGVDSMSIPVWEAHTDDDLCESVSYTLPSR